MAVPIALFLAAVLAGAGAAETGVSFSLLRDKMSPISTTYTTAYLRRSNAPALFRLHTPAPPK